MLNSYYLQKLIQRIKTLESLKKHSLLNGQWKNAGYILLSQLIQDKLDKVLNDDQKMAMGTTIHARTLTDIFRGKKNYDDYLHPHALNTLNKLTIFANYKSWDHFTTEIDKLPKEEFDNTSDEELLEFTIRKAMATELELYRKSSTSPTSQLEQLFIKEEAAFKNIVQNLAIVKEKNWTLSNEYNPSENQLLTHSIQLLTTTTAEVTTKEDWLLAWWHLQEETYTHRYQKVKDCIYFLEKIDSNWKIKTISSNSPLLKTSTETTSKVNIPPAIDQSAIVDMTALIRQAMTLQFQTYFNLPLVQSKLLSTLFIAQETAFREIVHNLLLAKERNWTINNLNNPSSNDLIDCTIKQINSNTAQIITKEYWLLWWWSSLENKYAYIHKEVSEHIYLLQKINNQWLNSIYITLFIFI